MGGENDNPTEENDGGHAEVVEVIFDPARVNDPATFEEPHHYAEGITDVVVNGVGKHGSMTGYGYDQYHYADDYTSHHNTSEEDPATEENPGEQVDRHLPSVNGTGLTPRSVQSSHP